MLVLVTKVSKVYKAQQEHKESKVPLEHKVLKVYRVM